MGHLNHVIASHLLQMKEYGELEKHMKKALVDVEKREKHLNVNEQEVSVALSFVVH